MILDVISGALLLSGAFLCLVAGIGVVRLPDVFARMHAATKAATLGLMLVSIAALFQVRDAGEIVALVLIVVVQFLTSPVAAHMVGRAAYRAGGLLSDETVVDELAGRTDTSAAE